MLTPRPHRIGTAHLPPLANTQAPFTDLADPIAEARAERLAQAEVTARRGTVETYLDFKGYEVASVWSHGVYALLERDPLAGPLARDDFILQYVHRDDRQRLTAALRAARAGDAGTELRYRIVTPGERVLDVKESHCRVASGAHGDVMFADLEAVRDSGLPTQRLAQLPAAVRAMYGDAVQAPAVHNLIVAFDALRDGEQRRLSREMHDDFGQLLAAMKVDLSLLERKAAQLGQPACRLVASLHELVDAMLVSVRRIIADLPPLAIEEHGLFGALERLVCSFRKRHAILIRLHTEATATCLSKSLELSVYRIIQEALNNIVRHANARNASISLRQAGSNVLIVIQDDGQGTSAAQTRKSGSYGLASMQERVAALDGVISISGDKGNGTCIQIAIPANASAAAPVT